MEYVIETSKLTKKFSRKAVLNELDIHVPKGSIYGLIGKNGAGKTTFMRILCGFVNPTSGVVSINGVDSKSKKMDDVRRKMSAIVEAPGFYGDETVYSNMKHQCLIRGVESFEVIDELLKIVSLENEKKKLARKLSLGMKQRLGIAMALVGDVDIIVLDEPMNGLDPEGMVDIRNLIVRLNEERGITFVISSHLLDELSKVSTHYGFIDEGRIVKEISCDEIREAGGITTTIKSDDVSKLVVFFTENGFKYSVQEDDVVVVYKELSLEDLSALVENDNVVIKELHVNNTSLENFYLNMTCRNGGMRI